MENDFDLNGVSESKPVVVIGAGVAGSSAAWRLKKRGVPVVLLEKSPHIGGRIQSEDRHGCKFESGMQFYYSAYGETKKLLREMQLEEHLSNAHITGYMTWQGKVGNFDKTSPWLALADFGDNFRLWKAVGKRVPSLLTMKIFDYEENDPLDQISVDEYFGSELSKKVYELAIRPMVSAYSFAEPEGHSLAMVLRILKLGAIAKTHALARGNDALPKALAEKVGTTSAEATSINIKDGQVHSVSVLRDGKPETIETNRVVCALPPPSGMKLFTASAPELSQRLSKIDYTCTIMVNFLLDQALPGNGWVYMLTRDDGHRAAFAIDCMKRCPSLFPHGKSVIQVSFVNPLARQYLEKSDTELTTIALEDMKAFIPNMASMVKEVSVVRRSIAVPSFQKGMFRSIRQAQQEASRIAGLRMVGDYLKAPLVEGAIRSAMIF